MLDGVTRLCVIRQMADGAQIQKEREKRGWSQARVAEIARGFVEHGERAKLVQQVVDRIEKGANSKYRNAVLLALELPIVGAKIDPMPSAVASSIEEAHDAPPFRSLAGRMRDVPELGIAVGGDGGDFEMNGKVVGRQPRPPALVGREIFAVRVKNDSMKPRFKDGELVYVERNREPAVGDDAVIELLPPQEGVAGPAFIKELVSKNSRVIVVQQHNPPETLTFQRSDIKQLYRVVPWNEAFGV